MKISLRKGAPDNNARRRRREADARECVQRWAEHRDISAAEAAAELVYEGFGRYLARMGGYAAAPDALAGGES